MNKNRLSIEKQKRLIDHFVGGTTARLASEIVGVNPKTEILYYHRFRQLACESITPEDFSGELELDESYFGGVRKGKRGRGTAGKTPVFGILKHGGKVYSQMVSDRNPVRCCLL